jgi:hypothetical protein
LSGVFTSHFCAPGLCHPRNRRGQAVPLAAKPPPRRHGTSDIGTTTNGSSEEPEQTKKAQLETDIPDNAIAQGNWDNGSG